MQPISEMNTQERHQLTKRVRTLLEDLDKEDALARHSQGIVHLDQQSVGRLSRMDALQVQAMAKATQSRRDQQRARLNRFLAASDDPDLGTCEACGEDIPFGRLKLDPTTSLCVECAS